jgi:hypothetical protein
MTRTNHRSAPTARQLAYLKALAQRTGRTFSWPHNRSQASREIARLRQVEPSTPVEHTLEQLDDRAVREAAEDSVAVCGFEVLGYGSSATWRQRS